MSDRVKIYFDFRDWWVGAYVGPNHVYICPLPTLVIRVRHRKPEWASAGTANIGGWDAVNSVTYVSLHTDKPRSTERWHMGTLGPLVGCVRPTDHPVSECVKGGEST